MPGMGFFASVGKGWSFIKEAFKMAFENRSLLKPSVYLVVTTILYIVAWVAILIATDFDFEENQATGAILGAACTFGSFLIFYFFQGMTVNMVDAHLEGNEVSVKEAFRDARQNFVAICFLAVISTIVQLLANAIRGDGEGGGNIAGRIIAGIIESVWTVVTFLLLPAIIIEDIGLRAALKRVRQLHKGNLMLIGIGEVGVRAVSNLIGFLVVLLIVGVVWFSVGTVGGTPGIVMAFGLGGILLALFAAFATFVRMAYYTCLYLWAVDVEKKGQEAPAPLPLARALKR